MKGASVDSSREWFEETEDFNQPAFFTPRGSLSTAAGGHTPASGHDFHNKTLQDAQLGTQAA